MLCSVSRSDALGPGCYACMHHLGLAWWSSTFSLNRMVQAVARVKNWHRNPFHRMSDLGLVEKRVKHASPRSRGRSKGQVATRSFSLPWLRLVHILLQSSAPIHPLDQGFSILITWPINIQETLIPESGIQIQESLRARCSSCIFPFCSPISDIRAKLILWMNKQAKAPVPIISD